MATADLPKNPVANWEEVRDEWLGRLNALVNQIEIWGQELDWSTRRINRRLDDSQLGTYTAPALMLQKEFTRILLEPIARFAPGTEGVVDLYLMPALDDIANIYYYGAGWHLHYTPPVGGAVATAREGKAESLTKDSLRDVIEELRRHAA